MEGGATAAVAHEDAGVAVVDSTLRRSAGGSQILWPVTILRRTLQQGNTLGGRLGKKQAVLPNLSAPSQQNIIACLGDDISSISASL